MFSSISWQEFANAALIALGLYYAVCGLLFYSKDLVRRFSNSGRALPGDSRERPKSPLMGRIRTDAPRKHEDLVEAGDLVVDSSTGAEMDQSEEGLLTNSVSHLLREIKVLARVVKESNGSKADAMPMFQSLLSNYTHLAETDYRRSITVFLHDTIRYECSFEVALEELDTWWTLEDKREDN